MGEVSLIRRHTARRAFRGAPTARARAWQWCVRLAGSVALLALLVATATATAAQPRRVVSMNLCTDQLAMNIAAPGQLVSVSYLSHNPTASVMAAEARRYPVNHGQAEEVFLLRPDLVLAGTFTSRETVALLRRLGHRVETFAPSSSFDDIRQRIVRLGKLLDREQHARELADQFTASATSLSAAAGRAKIAAPYYANSYTSGRGTLASEVVRRSGLINLGDRLGLEGTTRLPLEVLIMGQPALVVTSRSYATAPALAHETFSHPALRGVAGSAGVVPLPDKYWICGTPFTLEAVRRLRDAAGTLQRGRQP